MGEQYFPQQWERVKANLDKIFPEGEFIMVSGLKPTWQNLKSGGGFQTPVEEMVGLFTGWSIAQDNFQNNQVTFNFQQCQILKSDTAFPYSEWSLIVKYSDTAASSWGLFGASLAQAMGMDIELLDLDLCKGRWLHILRISNHVYGPDRNNPGQNITGTVWKVVAVIAPGQQVTSVLANPVAVIDNGLQPGVALPTPSPAPTAMPTPAIATPGFTAPLISTPMVPATPASPSAVMSPEQRALSLLHGRDTSAFFQVAIPDDVVKSDAALVNSILSNAFMATKIASGEVVRNEDGTHTVLALQTP